ncbi:MAG: hypothetical protein AAF750_08850 [Planctomycetota bacterium]
MIDLAALILLTLPHGGHVYGGRTLDIRVTPVVEGLVGDGWSMDWQLEHANARLGQGKLPLAANGTSLRIELPEVRVVVKMRLTYEVRAMTEPGQAAERTLYQGNTAFWVHPPPDRTWTQRLPSLGTVVCVSDQESPTLADALNGLGFEVRRVAPNNRMGMASGDWLVVDVRDPDARTLNAIQRAAARGTRVIMVSAVNSLETGERVLRPTTPLTSKPGHPLLAGLHPQWVSGWTLQQDVVMADRITDRLSTTPVVGWPHPDASASTPTETTPLAEPEQGRDRLALRPAPERDANPKPEPRLLDAVVWTQRVGKGHLIVWRLPVADWSADPRAGLVLRNALLYLASPPPPIGPSGLTAGQPSTEGSP